MVKEFAPRVSKREREKIDLGSRIDQRILRMNDEKLLRGALLDTIPLHKIIVRKQVRTKFNDESLRELGENIKENGLIQPLVVHREDDKYVLICGERRYRAMTLIEMKEAPCFILENKTQEELMAIQFSENSAREQLHYIDQADSIFGYKKLTDASERKIQASLGISKSEVHRCLLIAKLPKAIKEAAKQFNIEKYVLLEWDALIDSDLKNAIKEKILSGVITKRAELKKAISVESGATFVQRKKPEVQKNISANLFIKALQEKSKSLNLDKDTQQILRNLMDETKEMVDM
jgi:ParB family chromosome partitioning protein